MQNSSPPKPTDGSPSKLPSGTNTGRISSRDLLGESREVEIDHEGRIYRLRLTQLNKLILTM